MKYAKKNIPLFVIITVLLATVSFTNQDDKYFLIAKNLDIFATLFKEVNTYYVDDINPTDLVEKGIEAMLKSLDPYTNYISEDKIEDFRFMTTGEYGGIGAIIGKRDSAVMILDPYDGWPAQKAGLLISDKIVQIDDVVLTNHNTKQVSELLKGQAGTEVKLKIKRYNSDKLLDFTLIREKIQIDNVPYYGMIDEEIGYFELTGFTRDASKEVKKAIDELKKLGAKKFIFDLRRNSGGLLNQAVDVSNLFIDKNLEVVSTKGKVTDWNKTYNTLNTPLDIESPLIILTSGGTASAAEIVSGVVQDYDRGILVGKTTFGKGLVQATRPLTYNSQLKITTAKYYIPSGRCIQAIDYSNKEDGKAKKLADSVRTAFQTKGGRTVYDGAGLKPDVEVKSTELPEVLITLTNKNLIFDFVTDFYFKNEKIADAKSFEVTDELYNEFTNWVSSKELTYETKVEKELTDLIKIAEKQKVKQTIETEIEALQSKIKHNKNQDLITHKELIKEVLETEIVSRYYGNKGQIESTFDNDEDLKKAIELLKDSEKYNSILSVKKD